MKAGDFVTKLVRNQTDAYPSSFAPKIFRSQNSDMFHFYKNDTILGLTKKIPVYS